MYDTKIQPEGGLVTEESKTGRRGRPSKPDAVRLRRPVAVRLRDELRADLEMSAVRHGRSVSEEIEARLEASLAVQEYLKTDWGKDIFMLAQSLAGSVAQIENSYGSTWYEDDEAAETFKMTAACAVENCKVFFRNDLEGWEKIAKKSGLDPSKFSKEEAAEIFAAKDMRYPSRVKPKKRYV